MCIRRDFRQSRFSKVWVLPRLVMNNHEAFSTRCPTLTSDNTRLRQIVRLVSTAFRVRDCTGKPGAVFGEDLKGKARPRCF